MKKKNRKKLKFLKEKISFLETRLVLLEQMAGIDTQVSCNNSCSPTCGGPVLSKMCYYTKDVCPKPTNK